MHLSILIRFMDNARIVSYVSLPQAFLVSKPAELVRCFSDFGEVLELQIELFCILKLVRQYHRKLKNL